MSEQDFNELMREIELYLSFFELVAEYEREKFRERISWYTLA